MKKILLFLLICPLFINAQDLVSFKLTPNATFVTETNEDFVVVPFEGKTAHQIYQTLASNVSSIYNNPSKVMTGVEDSSIKIRAYSESIYIQKILGLAYVYKGHYQLEFRIKDGRVRVSAPFVEDEIDGDPIGSSSRIGYYSFKQIVKKWFKKGEIKEKEAKNVVYLEAQLNSIINAILGLSGSTSDIDDNW